MAKAALRVFTESKDKKVRKKIDSPIYDKVFVFDTETTIDEYQNLKFGSFAIYSRNIQLKIGLFYNLNMISEKELKELKAHCNKNPLIKLYELEEFIEKIFYPTVYGEKALCIGFNLPFDLSRLAIAHSYARGDMNGGFSLKLSENKALPRIKIKHLDSAKSFIKFGMTFKGNFRGNFLDLKTLAVTLTDEKHISLEKACDTFNKKYKKIKADEHGKITEKYIDYNINDTLATHELYEKLKEEFERYGIIIPLTEIYSSASLGKALLQQLGIRTFSEQNPNFPANIMGYLMSAYFGGRSEVKIRKKSMKVTVIDFLSMYPTMNILMGLWDFLIAEKIEPENCTEDIKKLLENIALEDLRKPETWKKFACIVEVLPEGDVLPLRMKYSENEDALNIGVNRITSRIPLWYALPDVIASRLLTGKVPKILKAVKFVPKDKQNDLTKTDILGIGIYPKKENLFKVLIEKRQEYKEKNDFRQKPLKILANATSYGIFVEMNTKSVEEMQTEVYSNEKFISRVTKIDEIGKYFNPIISVIITSGARLALAIAETILKNYNEVHGYCDTDGIAIPPKHVKEIQDFFKPLNPYSFDKPLFKEENKDVWFYGISAKRYVLYSKRNDKMEIAKHSLHGLGHLSNPFTKEREWQKLIWEDLLKLHYGLINREQFIRKYSDLFEISQLTVSSFEIMRRFKKLNKGKPYEKQIKPFNFFLIGMGVEGVKPISPFSSNPQEIVHKSFIDYRTGKILEGMKYWKPLSDTLWEYLNHKESKFNGDIGILERKYIEVDGILYIGKETNNIEETGMLKLPNYNTYTNERELNKRLLNLTPKEARKVGLNEETLRQIKKRVNENKPLKLYGKTTMIINKSIT